MKADSVLCEVGPESLRIIQIHEQYSIQQVQLTVLRLSAINPRNSLRIGRKV